MGIAILNGILTSLHEASANGPSQPEESFPLPSKFIACVRRSESVKKINDALGQHASAVEVRQDQNVASVEQADVIILACKPYMVKDILSVPGMKTALQGKLLISICAGFSIQQMEGILEAIPEPFNEKCTIIRSMPNTASLIRESMTVIATPDPPLPSERASLVTWIFKRIGDVVYLPASLMDVSTALCGSGPAFFALILEAAADGAVAMGLPRVEAQRMAAQTMKGAAGLILNGDHPALLKDKVSTPGGCTIGGLLVLEEGRVRGSVARAVREATVVASQLGKGVQGVNGTRF